MELIRVLYRMIVFSLTSDGGRFQVTILGFKAGSEVISVLLGFGGAAIGIVAQQFTSYVGSSSQ